MLPQFKLLFITNDKLFLQHIIIASITLLDSRNILILYRLCVSLCQYRLHDRVHCFMTFYLNKALALPAVFVHSNLLEQVVSLV